MSSIAIITDTDSSLPAEWATRYGIHQVPITIHFGEEVLRTGIDIDDARLFARVDREGVLPTTSAPSPGDFVAAYQAAFDAGADALICFCISSAVSATYNAAVVARNTMSERNISVVDTCKLSLVQGYMTIAAAEAAQAGASVPEILALATSVGERARLYACLATLKYLAMSGRVGHLAAGMASLLDVKPILTIREGKLDMLERVRTRRRAWERVINLTVEALKGKEPERMAILHVAAPAEAQAFADQLRTCAKCPTELPLVGITPGLSVHSGAGTVGVALVAAP
jgi:DegV family protein with EDD domain